MGKRQIGPITGWRTRLRLLEQADLPMTLAWRNQDHIRRWFVHSDLITPEQHWSWFVRYSVRDDDFVFIVEETQDLRKPVGQVSLYNVEWSKGRAEYGRLLIGEHDATGRGLAKEATQVLLDHAFGSLGLEEIRLEVFRENAAAQAIYKSAGFVVIGEKGDLLYMSLRR